VVGNALYDRTRSIIEIWWWTSIPYSLFFALWIIIFRPTEGFLAHVALPLLDLFELSLVSSVVWTATSVIAIAVFFRSPSFTQKHKTMLALGIAASLLGAYVEYA
jgi:hypothetical protein